jgi:hypothetical protein
MSIEQFAEPEADTEASIAYKQKLRQAPEAKRVHAVDLDAITPVSCVQK